MIQRNAFKDRLNRGETLAGAFVNIFSPELIELCGLLGLDFVILDGEHTSLTPETAVGLYRAVEVRDLPCVTRIGVNHPQVLQQYLESGALSVLIPLVNTREDAECAVEAVKYPPLGKRGLAASRISDWGLAPGGLAEHVRRSNEETLLAVQVETKTAVRNLGEILTVEGVDVVFFGPSDLSASLGLPGQPQHPRVVSLIEELSRKALQAGKVVGTIARTPEQVRFWKERGFRWLCTGITQLLTQGIESYLEGFAEE